VNADPDRPATTTATMMEGELPAHGERDGIHDENVGAVFFDLQCKEVGDDHSDERGHEADDRHGIDEAELELHGELLHPEEARPSDGLADGDERLAEKADGLGDEVPQLFGGDADLFDRRALGPHRLRALALTGLGYDLEHGALRVVEVPLYRNGSFREMDGTEKEKRAGSVQSSDLPAVEHHIAREWNARRGRRRGDGGKRPVADGLDEPALGSG
jgi:hypothetical protein